MAKFSSFTVFSGSNATKNTLKVNSASMKISKYSEFTIQYDSLSKMPVKINAQEQSGYGHSLNIQLLYDGEKCEKNTILLTGLSAV